MVSLRSRCLSPLPPPLPRLLPALVWVLSLGLIGSSATGGGVTGAGADAAEAGAAGAGGTRQQRLLARHNDPHGAVTSVCLGTSVSSAYHFVAKAVSQDASSSPRSSSTPEAQGQPSANQAEGVPSGPVPGNFLASAKYLYIGNPATLPSDSLCASNTARYLFNGSTFFWTDKDPLPGNAGRQSYVAPVWNTSADVSVDLDVLNLVNENLSLNYSSSAPGSADHTLPPYSAPGSADHVLPPYSSRQQLVDGSSLSPSLEEAGMLEEFTYAILSDPAQLLPHFAYGKAYAVMLMNERTGFVVYYWFYVMRATSEWCSRDSATGLPTNTTMPCSVGTSFGVKHDASGVDFEALHCAYDFPASCHAERHTQRRRRLLNEPRVRSEEGSSSRHRQQTRQRALASGTAGASIARPAASAATVCRLVCTSVDACTQVCT